MGDYKRLISYIYSYERGTKSKNAGFAKIESRNGICKVNISLRIADELMNEAEDNMLEVFFFYRENGAAKKIFLERIRIVSGCSMIKMRMNSDNIGNVGVSIDRITGIFICTKTFLNGGHNMNIVYASEWDDIPIDVNEFKEKIIEKENNTVDELLSEFINKNSSNSKLENDSKNNQEYGKESKPANKTEYNQESKPENKTEYNQESNQENNAEYNQESSLKNNLEYNQGSNPEGNSKNNYTQETNIHNNTADITDGESETEGLLNTKEVKEIDSETDIVSETEEDFESDRKKCDNKLAEILKEELKNDEIDDTGNADSVAGDYFRMLCNCYPKIRVNEINGECIKITPHDISYLPKKYWHLCNNSFLLHGFYNYKYLLLCEKKMDSGKKYLVGVPGMFHQKEQVIARMFGFTEFESNNSGNRPGNKSMKFGYWCMYL